MHEMSKPPLKAPREVVIVLEDIGSNGDFDALNLHTVSVQQFEGKSPFLPSATADISRAATSRQPAVWLGRKWLDYRRHLQFKTQANRSCKIEVVRSATFTTRKGFTGVATSNETSNTLCTSSSQQPGSYELFVSVFLSAAGCQ